MMKRHDEFYLTLGEQQKWAVRTFLRLEGRGDRADALSRCEGQKQAEEHLREYEKSQEANIK